MFFFAIKLRKDSPRALLRMDARTKIKYLNRFSLIVIMLI